MPARTIPQRGQPVPGAAADLGDVPRCGLTRSANEALKGSQHAVVATRLPAFVVPGRDGVVLDSACAHVRRAADNQVQILLPVIT